MQATAKRGVIAALLSAFLYGAAVPGLKGPVAGVGAATVAGLCYLGSGLGLLVMRTVQRRSWGGATHLVMPPTQWRAFWAATLLGGVVGSLCLYAGLQGMPASTTSLLLNLYTVFTVLLAGALFHEHVSLKVAAAAVFMIVGAVVLGVWGTPLALTASAWWGPILVLLTCLLWAFDTNWMRIVQDAESSWLIMMRGLVVGSVDLLFGAIRHEALPSPSVAGWVLLIGFISYGLSMTVFMRALRVLGSARTVAWYAISPFFGAGLGLLVLREPANIGFWVACAFMGAGFALQLTDRHSHEHSHTAASGVTTTHRHEHMPDQEHRHAHARVGQSKSM